MAFDFAKKFEKKINFFHTTTNILINILIFKHLFHRFIITVNHRSLKHAVNYFIMSLCINCEIFSASIIREFHNFRVISFNRFLYQSRNRSINSHIKHSLFDQSIPFHHFLQTTLLTLSKFQATTPIHRLKRILSKKYQRIFKSSVQRQ